MDPTSAGDDRVPARMSTADGETTSVRSPASGTAPAVRPLRYVAALDGLRCCAAVAIILGHAGSLYPASPRLIAQGGLLVVTFLLTFFVTSGFLIYRPLVAQQMRPRAARASGEGGKHFAWIFSLRRFMRIFPLYWAVLAVKCVVIGPGEVHTIVDWFQVIFLIPVPDPSVLVNGGLGFATWTLAIELPFYVIMPLFASWTRRLGKGWLRAYSGFQVQVLCIGGIMGLYTASALAARAPEVLTLLALPIGMLLATFEVEQWQRRKRFVPIAWLADKWWLCLGIFLVFWQVGAYLAYKPGSATSVEEVAKSGLLLNALLLLFGTIALFVTLCFGRPSLLSAILGSLPLRMVASLTYGTYLWHPVVLHELADRYGEGLWVLMGGTLVISFALALVTSLLVEAPIAVLRYKLDAKVGRTPRVGEAWAPLWLRPRGSGVALLGADLGGARSGSTRRSAAPGPSRPPRPGP